MWGRIKGQVNWSKEDQDTSEDDTIISRALLRYYAPEIPSWLSSAKGAEEVMRDPSQIAYSKSTSQYSLVSNTSQTYSQRSIGAERPRKFERSDSFASPSTSASEQQPRVPKHSASGLVSRLKNTNW